MPHARVARTGRATALLLAVAALLPAAPAQAAGASQESGHYCTAPGHPGLAARLDRDIAHAVSGRKSTLSFTVWDEGTGLTCGFRPNAQYDSASIVKVTLMTATLLRAQEEGRPLSAWEELNLRLMITISDNQSATNLYNSLGVPFIQFTLNRCGMHDTVLNTTGDWGLTQVTAHDEMKQLDVYTVNGTVLSPANQAYGLRLMSEVVPGQRWGTPFGAPRDITVQVKNGWLQRVTFAWRVHSLGIFTGHGRLYQMAVLTQEDPSMSYGIGTIQRIAWHVHHDLDSFYGETAGPLPSYVPDLQASEESDGSYPLLHGQRLKGRLK
ncbi:serine hydrolase [Streptomyces sp. NPDC086787]|uniref:serine hydrolase n=1 Tax=Streptomyces sp. NPDC086787 TaxID=3365759 RepID=UPI00380E71E1